MSSKITAAPLPPSSNFTGIRFRPQASATRRPTSGEPVKDIRLSPGCLANASPAVVPRPGTTFTTPSGIPASFTSFVRKSVDSGVSSAGLMTTVLPTARAGGIAQLLRRDETLLVQLKSHQTQG